MPKINKFQIGSWITIPNEIIVEIFTQFKFDFHVIDLEHSIISSEQAENLIRIIKLSQSKVIVRSTNNDEYQIKRILDSGADGLILPNIKNLNQLNKICNFIFYPPKGDRGVGLSRSSLYGLNFKNYFKKINNEIDLIIIIENKEAVENIDEILSSKFFHSIMIGPYDLSASLGIPGEFNNKLFKNTVDYIIQKAKKYKKQIGFHLVEPDNKEFLKIKKKFDFCIYSLDTKLIINSLKTLNLLHNK